jgi:glucose-1-phosphate thymidylyltransferase
VRAILLAGGSGTRIWPLSVAVNKQLLPVFDKPMIYYPLTTLMLAGATEIVVVTSPQSIEPMKKLLGNGNQWGIRIRYVEQEKPRGIPEAFLLAPKDFYNNSVALMLGDNLLYGSGLGESLKENSDLTGSRIFAYQVSNPQDYGVVNLEADGQPIEIVEKPENSRSNLAIPGLYFFDASVYDRARNLTPSPRGELEITDILNSYLNEGNLSVKVLERGTAWLDTGSAHALLAASEFVRVIEDRQGLKVGCPEEVSLRLGLVSGEKFRETVKNLPSGQYKKYLENIAF